MQTFFEGGSAELFTFGEDVGVCDDSFDAHLFHFGRGDYLQVGVDDREECGRSDSFVAGFEFADAARYVFMDHFECYCHRLFLEYLSFKGENVA